MAATNQVDGPSIGWWLYQAIILAWITGTGWLFRMVFANFASKDDLANAKREMTDRTLAAVAKVHDDDVRTDKELLEPVKDKLELLMRLRDSDRADQDRRHDENLQSLAIISSDIKQLLGRTPGH